MVLSRFLNTGDSDDSSGRSSPRKAHKHVHSGLGPGCLRGPEPSRRPWLGPPCHFSLRAYTSHTWLLNQLAYIDSSFICGPKMAPEK